MPETVKQCPLCGSAQSALFDQRTFHGQAVINRVCRACGLVYQSPRATEAELDHFYTAEYRQLYQGEAGPVGKDLAVQHARAEVLAHFMEGRIASPARHLDIGCSAGLLLKAFQAAFGSQPVGVEPGSAYRAYAQAQGLSVYASLADLKAAGEAPFDLISMAHVLEHIPDPVETLARLRQDLLKETGWLLLEVPNLYAHDCFETAHLVSFSEHSLAQTLKKSGFRLVCLETHGMPRSTIIPLYITLLARPIWNGEEPAYHIVGEKNVRLKRRLGMLRRRVMARLRPREAWIPVRDLPVETLPVNESLTS